MKRKGIVVLWRIAACIAAAIVLWTGYVQWKIYAAQAAASKEPADTAIVLGAALWNGVPSPALKERLEGARELYEEGAVRTIIVSGGLGSGSAITEAEGMKRYLVEFGIPEEAVYLENQAMDTWQNIGYSLAIMEEEGWSSATIVTHHYHGARALDMARTLSMEEPQLWTVESSVLNKTWHQARETLAYGKWTLQKWLYLLGG